MGVCETVSVWCLIVLSAYCFDEFSTPVHEVNWNQQLKPIEMKHEEQNEPGLIIENKLKLAKTMRENVVSLLGNILFGERNFQLTQIEISAFLQLHQIIQSRTIPSTNLLPLINNKDGAVKVVFQYLEHILPVKIKVLANICFGAVSRGNFLHFDLLKNIPENSTMFGQTISEEELDSPNTILNEIPFLINRNAIKSTSQLIAGLMVNVPLSVVTYEVMDAEDIVYDYLMSITEGVNTVNQHLGDAKQLVIYILDNLYTIPDLSSRVINMGKTLIPFLKLSPRIVIQKCSNQLTCVQNMQLILANNTLNLNHLLSFINSDYFPNDIVSSARQVISLQNMNLLNIPKMFKKFNFFAYRNQVDLLLAVLNQMQNMMIPHNVINMVKAIYINAKISFEHANNVPKFLSSDMQVDQLLNAFMNKKSQVLITSINTIKSALLDKQINWNELNFDYSSCKDARKCLSKFLLVISRHPELQHQHLGEALNKYFNEVGDLINPTHPVNARPVFYKNPTAPIPNLAPMPNFANYPLRRTLTTPPIQKPWQCRPPTLINYFGCNNLPWIQNACSAFMRSLSPRYPQPNVMFPGTSTRRFGDNSNVDLLPIYYNA